MSDELILLPQPRRMQNEARRVKVDPEPRVRVDPQAVPQEQGYRLEVSEDGVAITAHDDAGAFYARQTLKQILRQFDPADGLPAVRIDDWPDFARRGVMLDVSRDKVPTLETLKALIDRLAYWKVNEFQLYTEHTFAYPGHEPVWQNASPVTPEEIRELNAWCAERHVDLVPNQNSFGHMHRWLEHEQYRQLAEAPEGWPTPWGSWNQTPFSLCPTDPRSLELLTDLYAKLLPHFTSDRFNVGCDETWDLGHGRSADACEQRGRGRVYLEFLQGIHKLVEQHGRTMMFWGDIINKHAELIPELPEDVIALEWGYEYDHPFDENCPRFAEAGIRFYVCPDTSSWNSLAGRTDNALANIANAASAGLAHGAVGLLNTDWGDNGHWQPLAACGLGYAAGAAYSWCLASNRDADLPAQFDRFAFEDEAGVMGRLIYDLGNVYQLPGASAINASPLFKQLFQLIDRPIDSDVFEGFTIDGLRRTIERIDELLARLPEARMQRGDAALIADELTYAGRMLQMFAELGIARLEHRGEGVADLPAETRRELAATLEQRIADHRRIWLARNRPGGLEDSARPLHNLREKLI